MSLDPTSSLLRQPSVIIIGAGMTGILMAIKCKQAGIKEVRVLEKTAKVGGTWRENTYPGVACDVPAHMYTYSFETNPHWSNLFAKGPEIQKYFEYVADKYQVMPLVQFNELVTDARYAEGRWTVTTCHQQTQASRTYSADFVICATGILHHPAYPDIKGLDEFKGAMFHTARWQHEVAIGPKTRVGVIGTGSTAAQAIPELIDTGAQVSVFQRTPQWVLPVGNVAFSDWVKALMAQWNWAHRLYRNAAIFVMEHIFTKAVIGRFVQKKLIAALCKLNLRLSIKDKQLREKLTPDYQVGCKRIIVNNTFYKRIQKPNAHLITQGIDHITDKGVVTRDGTLHELDVLVLSTGFKPFNFMRPMNLIGREALHIDDAWREKIKVYRSMMLPNYPNFFLMLGPNTPIGNFSVIAMSEVQGDYVLKMIDKWRHGQFDEVEARPEAIDEFNAYVKAGLKNTSWVGGCQSWYLDQDGDPILWPYTWKRWVKEMAEPQMEHMLTQSFRR